MGIVFVYVYTSERYSVVSIANIYQLVDRQRFPTGELIENVYFYSDESGAGSAEDLSLAFNNDMLTGIIRDVQSIQLEHVSINVQSLGDPADFYIRVLSGAFGVETPDCMPAHDAVNFTLRTSSRAVRPGSKRIGGLPDFTSYYTNGQVTDAARLVLYNDIRVAMATIVNATAVDYSPIIVKRVFVPAAGDHGDYYRLPTTDGELAYFPVVAALFNPRITHQISRGNGR